MEEEVKEQMEEDIVKRFEVPPGKIFVNDRWNDSELLSLLSRRVQVQVMASMDFIDFFPCSDFGVVFVTEGNLVAGTRYKRNLVRLKKAAFEKSAAIIERTEISEQHFSSVQQFAVLELGLGIIPVSGIQECAHALVAIVRMGCEDKSVPFMMKRRAPPIETYLLKTLLTVPSLGETKAQALLLKYKSLYNICNAKEEELSRIIGASSAKQVYNFFHNC
ncbi:Fanconi anemia core complex-associated protein 24-like [Uloborus diversus]|uniref:Fanconi anemia core complex-associated protein 24-like n=1 Tax=Uloborus diversus TaxID=327109 RepID=UPI00240A5490|nr:Fanconi anemia core complex-associated protein 24-like [Uloborus diversus]